MFLHTNSCRLCCPFAEHNAHEKRKKANREQVVSSVINSVHIEVNGCHYSVNICPSPTSKLQTPQVDKRAGRQGLDREHHNFEMTPLGGDNMMEKATFFTQPFSQLFVLKGRRQLRGREMKCCDHTD